MTREPKHWSDPPEPKPVEGITYFDRAFIIPKALLNELAASLTVYPVGTHHSERPRLLGYPLDPWGAEHVCMKVPFRQAKLIERRLKELLRVPEILDMLQPKPE